MEHSGNTGTANQLRLADLRLWHVIVASCSVCRHHRRLPIIEICLGRPEHVPLMALRPKLRCSRCGNRTGNRLTVSLSPRN